MVIENRNERKDVVPMCHKKALLPALCVSLCLCGGMIPGASAAGLPNQPCQEEIVPYALYIKRADCNFSIAGEIATVRGSVTGQTGVADRCRIVVYLQEKSGSTWKNIATWSDESDGGRASVFETKKVTAGNTYRAKAVVTAWSGGASETKTIISTEQNT